MFDCTDGFVAAADRDSFVVVFLVVFFVFVSGAGVGMAVVVERGSVM